MTETFKEWYSKLSKPEKRMIALIWLTVELCEEALKNPNSEIGKLAWLGMK